jgi:hypothetical protein
MTVFDPFDQLLEDMPMSLRSLPTDNGDLPHSALVVELLPPGTAFDFEFVAARLHDRALLHSAVAVRIFRAPLLAVPVGGCRRGGRMNAGPLTVALAVRGALDGQEGFPRLRVSEGARHGDWYVEWGESAPPYPARSPESRRFFGYGPPGASPSCAEPVGDSASATSPAEPDARHADGDGDGGCVPGGSF